MIHHRQPGKGLPLGGHIEWEKDLETLPPPLSDGAPWHCRQAIAEISATAVPSHA